MYWLNPLLHRLFLDHDIVFYFHTTLKKFKKNLSLVLNNFVNILENGALLYKSKCSIFLNIFEYMIFQRFSKGDTNRVTLGLTEYYVVHTHPMCLIETLPMFSYRVKKEKK